MPLDAVPILRADAHVILAASARTHEVESSMDDIPDPVAILAALQQPPPQRVARVLGGNDTLIWRADYATASYALRLFRPTQRVAWEREQEAHAVAAQAGIAVPTIHAAAIWNDRPVLLLGWCAGEPLAMLLQRQPWRTWRLGRALGRVQAQIHQATPPAAWPTHLWIEASGACAPRIRQLLRAQPERSDRLLHLDYHLMNVLSDGNHITAVLDWANAQSGDPRADLARTYTQLWVEPYEAHESRLLRTWRWVLCQAWRGGYKQVHGSCAIPPLFQAWAGEYMQRDLAHRVGQTGSWWQPQHLAQIARWTARQWRQAERCYIPNV